MNHDFRVGKCLFLNFFHCSQFVTPVDQMNFGREPRQVARFFYGGVSAPDHSNFQILKKVRRIPRNSSRLFRPISVLQGSATLPATRLWPESMLGLRKYYPLSAYGKTFTCGSHQLHIGLDDLNAEPSRLGLHLWASSTPRIGSLKPG